ncbi:hypothetical protein [Bacillus sp. Hm123]|uniref:hypothetical protein n=1 Tax=Bacillus sp. Hm123 TaxID=3450745 RepID=UPI003F41EBDB
MDSIEVEVIGVKKVSFTNDEGTRIQGTKVYYYSEYNKDENIVGYNPLSAWFNDFDMFDKLKKSTIPGKFKMEYVLKLQGSQASVEVKNFEQLKKATV